MFLKIDQKIPALESLFIKMSLQHRCSPVKFAKFLRTPFLQKTSSGCFWKKQASVNEPLTNIFGFLLFLWSTVNHYPNKFRKSSSHWLIMRFLELKSRDFFSSIKLHGPHKIKFLDVYGNYTRLPGNHGIFFQKEPSF